MVHAVLLISSGVPVSRTNSIVEQIRQLGSLIEWSSRNMVAVDAVDDEHAQQVANFLWDLEHKDQLIYETGRTA